MHDPQVSALVWTLIVLAILFAAGGLIIFGKFVKLMSVTNFWLEQLHAAQREIISNQNATARILKRKIHLMLRRFSCPVDGTTESSMAYADDPWCSDNCHKAFAEAVGLPQREVTPLVAWAVIDATWAKIYSRVSGYNKDIKPSTNLFEILEGEVQ